MNQAARIFQLRQQSLANVNTFLECVFSLSGHKQASLHVEGQKWLDEHREAMVCWPRDHGKTTQIAGRTCHELGRNPNLRIKYCCESDDVAVQRSRFIRNLVSGSEWVKFCYPHLKPDNPWGDVSWTVKRPGLLVDATFHALGVGTASTGGRCDLLIADDLVGVKSLRSRQERERAKSYWRNNLVNLCEPDAHIWIVYTPWTADDLNADLEKVYPVLKRPVGEGFLPVWPEHWPHEKLAKRCRDIGELAFARGYRLQTVSEGETILGPWLHLASVPAKPVRTIISADLAIKVAESNDRSALAVSMFDGTRWVIVACWASRCSVPDMLRVLESLCIMYKPQVIAYEDTGQQDGIWQLAKQDDKFKRFASLLRPVKHTRNKFSRLEAMAPHFASGLIAFGANGDMLLPELQLLWDEITTAPLAPHDDTWDAVLTGLEFALTHSPGQVR